MRNHLLPTLTTAVLVLAAGAAFASTPPAGHPASSTPAQPTAHAATPATAPAGKTTPPATPPATSHPADSVRGVLTAVDATAKSFTIEGKDGKTETFTTGDATKISQAGKEIKLADLKVGEKVKLQFTASGKDKMATVVFVVPPKSKDKKKAEPPAGR